MVSVVAAIGALAFGCWIASEWPEGPSFAVSPVAGGVLSLAMLLAVFEGLIKVVWPDPLIYTWFAGES